MMTKPNLALGRAKPIERQSNAVNATRRSTAGIHRGMVRLSTLLSQYFKPERHQQTSFNLPVEVLRLVFDLLDRDDIYSLRLVSRAWRHLLEAEIFGSLVFHDRTQSSIEVFAMLCKRLCDSKDTLRDIVHHVQIERLKQQTDYLGKAKFVKALGHIKDLRDFSWHMKSPIPKHILNLLHTKHTSARIHIVNNARDAQAYYLPPDFAALSSPQLHSLDYTAYGATEHIHPLQVEFYSELPAIKDSLLKARNLKYLRLQVCKTYIPRQGIWTKGPGCLTFNKDDVFPPLQDLRFDFERYEMGEKYCRQWAEAMDWTKLRKLDLDGGSPEHLLASLTGRVPQLRILNFGLRQSKHTWGYPNLNIFQAFFDSIEGLEEAVIKNESAVPFEEIQESLLLKHGHSLKTFRISYHSTEAGWNHTDVENLGQKCPGIRHLALKVSTERDHSLGWPKATMGALQAFQSLRTLELTLALDAGLQLGQTATELLSVNYGRSGSRHFYLKESAVEAHVVSLYKHLAGTDRKSTLHSIKVRLQTDRQYNEWVFVVQAQSRDGKTFRMKKHFSKANPGFTFHGLPDLAYVNGDPFG